MTSQTETARHFRALHKPGEPLLLPNPWDAGSAKVLASLGFKALATTSSGFAATLGRADGSVTRDEALAHAADIVAATDLPVSADLEDCFAAEPAGVAETVRLAIGAGLAGCSVEDYTRHGDDPIFDIGLATERVAAAAEAAHAGPVHFVLTARAENYLHGRPDLADTIARLQAYQEAGADVLYAPGLTRPEDIGQVLREVDRPVNVLAMPGAPAVGELAEAGVARISVGGAFAFAALGALVNAATELRDQGTYGFRASTAIGRDAIKRAFLSTRPRGKGFHTVTGSSSRPLLSRTSGRRPLTLYRTWVTSGVAITRSGVSSIPSAVARASSGLSRRSPSPRITGTTCSSSSSSSPSLSTSRTRVPPPATATFLPFAAARAWSTALSMPSVT